jgi:hypothetical protein
MMLSMVNYSPSIYHLFLAKLITVGISGPWRGNWLIIQSAVIKLHQQKQTDFRCPFEECRPNFWGTWTRCGSSFKNRCSYVMPLYRILVFENNLSPDISHFGRNTMQRFVYSFPQSLFWYRTDYFRITHRVCEEYELWSSSLRNFLRSSVISVLLGPYVFLSALLSSTVYVLPLG